MFGCDWIKNVIPNSNLLKIYFVALACDLPCTREDNDEAVLTFDFDGVRLDVCFKYARHGDEPSQLLETTLKQLANRSCGDRATSQRLRRIAMVYSAPERQITLAEELRQ